MVKGLSRSNSGLIGFVHACLCSGAITIKEAHEWVYRMIEQYDDLPNYMYYLMETSDSMSFYESIRESLGFTGFSDLTDAESRALSGLGYYRNPEDDWEANYSKGLAIKDLKRNPQVIDRFKETFPFIKLPDNLPTLEDKNE